MKVLARMFVFLMYQSESYICLCVCVCVCVYIYIYMKIQTIIYNAVNYLLFSKHLQMILHMPPFYYTSLYQTIRIVLIVAQCISSNYLISTPTDAHT